MIQEVPEGVILYIFLSCCYAASLCREAANSNAQRGIVVVFALSGEDNFTPSNNFLKAVLLGDGLIRSIQNHTVEDVFQLWKVAIEAHYEKVKKMNEEELSNAERTKLRLIRQQ